MISSTALRMTTLASHELRKKLTRCYPFGGPERFIVPNEKIDWDTPFPEYDPPYFTTQKVLTNKAWADEEEVRGPDQRSRFKWNEQDGLVNRKSHGGQYKVDEKGYPLNPVGRTAIRGRGNLGKWGPNHACDPVVTRWKQSEGAEVCDPKVLQFIAIQRRDTGEWAIPGGMIDPGETATEALKREFLEEVFSIDDASPEEKLRLKQSFRDLFSQGLDVYKGYVDDPRNTDNAWIETESRNFHTDDPSITRLELKAGSDAKNAQWVDISSQLTLYASHKALIEKVAKLRNASW